MKVRTLKAHDNQFGKKYRKAKGDIYDHPQPTADLHFGYVEEVRDEPEADATEPSTLSDKDTPDSTSATAGDTPTTSGANQSPTSAPAGGKTSANDDKGAKGK